MWSLVADVLEEPGGKTKKFILDIKCKYIIGQ